MSLKKIDDVKKSKWFSLWDFIVFGVLAATSIALIIAFTVGRDKSPLGGFSISYRGEQVFTYEFGGTPQILDKSFVSVEEGENGFFVHFTTEGGKGYNTVWVDTNDKTVDVTDSNCSSHKDCVHTEKLKNNSSLPIICTVHNLTVAPLKFVDDGIIIV